MVDPTDARTAGHEEAGPAGEAPVDRWEQRFTIPVIIAALASVPAVFLSMMDEPWELVGEGINYASLAVFISEAVVLFWLAGDRWQWIKEHKFLVGVTLATIPAVLFAVGGVQALRLLRVVRGLGALRIIRVGRIIKAGRVLRERAGLTGLRWKVAFGLVSLLAATFVALVLADPTAQSRVFLEDLVDTLGPLGAVAAGAILAGATFVVIRYRKSKDAGAEAGSHGPEAASEGAEGAAERHASGR